MGFGFGASCFGRRVWDPLPGAPNKDSMSRSVHMVGTCLLIFLYG